jgi:hypothetical protein
MKRLSFAGITLLSGILLSLAFSCKKKSSEENFFKVQLDNESFSLDSIFAFADSSGPDFYSVYIGGQNTKTGNAIELIGFSFPKDNIGGTYVHEDPLPYPLPNPYKQFADISVRLQEGQYKGFYNIGGTGSVLTIESSDNNTLKGSFLSALNPPLNAGQGGILQYLQISGQFRVSYYFRH